MFHVFHTENVMEFKVADFPFPRRSGMNFFFSNLDHDPASSDLQIVSNPCMKI